MDSGATYNYIGTNSKIGESVPLPNIYTPKTLHGYSKVSFKKIINVLNYNLTFFKINELVDYDMILGVQGLREIKATINFFEYRLYYHKPSFSHKINYSNDSSKFENEIANLMQKNKCISETLPATIEATIRTENEEPIYTKQYPYPQTDREFIDNEIKKLLEIGVIEKLFTI